MARRALGAIGLPDCAAAVFVRVCAMRRSRIVIATLGLAFAAYLAFAVYQFGDRLRTWFGFPAPVKKLETEPIVQDRPVSAWVEDLRHEDAATRAAAAEALGDSGKSIPNAPGVAQGLTALLKDPDPSVRRAAAAALGKVYVWANSARQPLGEAMKDPELAVRKEVLLAIALLARDESDALELL